MIDYKKLLWKYMNHVGREEGLTYVGRIHRGDDEAFVGDEFFTKEEFLALREIEDMPRSFL
jgi:hypothetical protein